MPVTDDQVQALAYLATTGRPHGAPQWDRAGSAAAIRRVQHLAFPDVMAAVARGTADRTLRTPAAIGDPTSSCWRERLTKVTPTVARRFDRGTCCSICSEPEPVCRTQPHGDHDYLSAADATRRATTRPTQEQPA